jgi:hypothetical protein
MTELEEISEYIRNAMNALEAAHQAGEELRNHTTPDNVDAFTRKCEELCQHLTRLKQILEHESDYSVDELADVLSQLFQGKPAPYRTLPRIESGTPED